MAEDADLCTRFKYHKHRLVFLLSAMRSHADEIEKEYALDFRRLSVDDEVKSFETKLEESIQSHPDVSELVTYDIENHFFEDRIRKFCAGKNLRLTMVDSPGFLTSKRKFREYVSRTNRPFMQTFYKQQRRDLGILLEDDNMSPLNGKWSFDKDNRKKLPRGISIPSLPSSHPTSHTEDVQLIVDQWFPDHPGETGNFRWATTRRQVLYHLNDFLNKRFANFGPYEDAIDSEEVFLFHSVLSPYINVGLVTPDEVVTRALNYHEENETHFPSVEGFVRQIVGWREFMRGIYHEYGEQLNINYFGHYRKMKSCWYNGTTGIPPLDDSIKKALKNGYTHHIERLMILGNTMLLTELDPDEVYSWFMEMYVDSADWVMAPNVYGMSQFADGGIFATKPYIGGANYIRKMSDYGKGDWEIVMNGLYWRFIHNNVETFANNQRMSMMVATLGRMGADKKEQLFAAADEFIERVTE